MPRSLDPNSQITMVLACDVDKPKETQPRIFAKTPTLNQQRKLIALVDSFKDGGQFSDKIDAILDTAASMLTGWENIPFELSRETIGDVLSLEEIIEVLTFLVSASQPTADDKKKSE